MAYDPAITALCGALGGAAIGFLGGFINNSQKRSWDKQDALIKRQWEIENRDIQEQNRMTEQKFEIYNKILMNAGETVIVTNAGHRLSFEFNAYSEKIRPLLYERLHVLDKDVKERVQSMDSELGRMSFFEEATDEDEDTMASSYNKLMHMIGQKYKNQ